MTGTNADLRAALAALESERVENVRLRRSLLDMIYNLDEENMPAVIARIREAEEKIAKENEKLGLLFTTTEAGESVLSGDALVAAINEGGGASLILESLSLAADAAELTLSSAAVSVSRTESHPPRTYLYEATLSPDALEMNADDGGAASGGDKLTLSPRALCMPYLRRKAAAPTSGLYPLYIDKNGNVVAAYS